MKTWINHFALWTIRKFKKLHNNNYFSIRFSSTYLQSELNFCVFILKKGEKIDKILRILFCFGLFFWNCECILTQKWVENWKMVNQVSVVTRYRMRKIYYYWKSFEYDKKIYDIKFLVRFSRIGYWSVHRMLCLCWSQFTCQCISVFNFVCVTALKKNTCSTFTLYVDNTYSMENFQKWLFELSPLQCHWFFTIFCLFLVHNYENFTSGLPRMEALVRIRNIPIVETGVKTAGNVYFSLKVIISSFILLIYATRLSSC